MNQALVNVLIVDDEPELREIVANQLSETNWTLLNASDGSEALRILTTHSIDIVISDIEMPEMNGLELLRNCREREINVPFVFVTSHSQKNNTVSALRLRATDFLEKPWGPADLLAAAKSALASRLEAVQWEQAVHAAARMATLGEITASILHEIKNPLAIITGRAELLMASLRGKDPNPAETLENADRITVNSKRIAAIVKNVQRFSHVDSTAEFESVQAHYLISEAQALCIEEARCKQVKFDASIDNSDTSSCLIECRPLQIIQVLVNLLNNAIDAVADYQDRWVRVQCETLQSKVAFHVTNGGPLMSEDLAAQIFKPFFTTKAVGFGTGLGLSIARRILAAHSGELTLDLSGDHTKFTATISRYRN